MKKRILSFLVAFVSVLSLTVCLPTVAVSAQTVSDYLYEVLDDGTLQITGYVGGETELDIPSEIDGYFVTSIGKEAFYNQTSITGVDIPDSITSIGKSAFSRCSGLESVIIPDSVTNIGTYAFYRCSDLKSATISDSVTTISQSAFQECTSLTSISVPDSVVSIENDAFSYCTSLESINIPDSVIYIGSRAFAMCESLKSIEIPASVTELGTGVFSSCNEDLIIYCYKNSAGLSYAKNNIYILLDDFDKVTASTNYNKTYDAVRIFWDKVYGASGYRIYQWTSSGWKTIKTISGNSTFNYRVENLVPGTTYKFKVKAYIKYNGTTYWGTASDTITTKTKTFIVPTVKAKTNFTYSTDAVRINWNKVSGASGYRIYQWTSSGWKTIKTISGNGTFNYRISGLKSGTTYKFKVKAYQKAYGQTYWGTASDTIITTTKPGKVSFTVTAGEEKVTIKWSKVTGATGYKIYYKTTKNGDWVSLKSTTGTSFTKTGLDGGRTYYFAVKAYRTVNSKTYYGTLTSKTAVPDYKYSLYYIKSSSSVYTTGYAYKSTVSGGSWYTGHVDYRYSGYIVIDYMSTEVLIKSSNVSKRSNAKILPTGAIGQYGGSIAGYSACGPTAVAILVNSEKNQSWSKDSLILFSEKNSLNDQGSLRGGGGMTAPKLLSLIKMYSGGKYTAKNIYSSNSTSTLKKQIDNGHRAIVVVQYTSSIVTHYNSGTHFVVICGYEYIDNVLYFYYADPYYGNGGRSLRRVSASVLSKSMGMVVKEPKALIVLN